VPVLLTRWAMDPMHSPMICFIPVEEWRSCGRGTDTASPTQNGVGPMTLTPNFLANTSIFVTSPLAMTRIASSTPPG
jgi:hypothetical protein